MQVKKYGFTLPRTITREQWRKIHSGARADRRKNGNVNNIVAKYGHNFLYTIHGVMGNNYFWCIQSHFKHDRRFIKSALRGNRCGLTSERIMGKVQSLQDPENPLHPYRPQSKVAG